MTICALWAPCTGFSRRTGGPTSVPPLEHDRGLSARRTRCNCEVIELGARHPRNRDLGSRASLFCSRFSVWSNHGFGGRCCGLTRDNPGTRHYGRTCGLSHLRSGLAAHAYPDSADLLPALRYVAARARPPVGEHTLAWLITAVICYIPSNVLPVMYVNGVGGGEESTILSGVLSFWKAGAWDIAVLIFTASIAVPATKFLALGLLLWTVRLEVAGRGGNGPRSTGWSKSSGTGRCWMWSWLH